MNISFCQALLSGRIMARQQGLLIPAVRTASEKFLRLRLGEQFTQEMFF
jgi:hypothetical protein